MQVNYCFLTVMTWDCHALVHIFMNMSTEFKLLDPALPPTQDTGTYTVLSSSFYKLLLHRTQRMWGRNPMKELKFYVRCNSLITCEHIRDDRLEGEIEDVVYKVSSENLPDPCPSSCKHRPLFIIIHLLLLLKWCIHVLIQIMGK